MAMDEGRVTFLELFAKLQTASSWPHTVSVLEKYSKLGARFQVAFALCRYFDTEEQKKKPSEEKKQDRGLLSVCEQHMREIVAAKFIAGWCYEEGVGGAAKDEERSAKYYRQAAVQGYAMAQFRLAICYSKGRGVAKDMKEAARLFEHWRKGLDNPNHQNPYLEASSSRGGSGSGGSGSGGSTNESNSGDSGKSICSGGDTGNIGDTHAAEETGTGGLSDDTGASDSWKSNGSSISSCGSSSCGSGDSGSHDRGSTGNIAEVQAHENKEEGAIKDLKEAASRGDQLPRMDNAASGSYEYKEEQKEIKEVLDELAKQDQTDRKKGVEKEAAKLYEIAAAQGNAQAQFNLALCYDVGKGVVKDGKEAVRLYRLAADQGHAGAQCNLGHCYENGEGVKRNTKEAFKFYRLAAEQGHVNAQFNLGLCYKHGEGVKKDAKEAVRLYRLAADQGNATAQCNLGLCYEKGEGVTKDAKEAVRFYRLAAEQGDPHAQFNLGLCYKRGVGVAVDMKEAGRLFVAAKRAGRA